MKQYPDERQEPADNLGIHKKVGMVVFLVFFVMVHAVIVPWSPMLQGTRVSSRNERNSWELAKETFPASSLLYGYDSQEEMNERRNRFPDIQARVRLYMSNWYLPACNSSNSIFYHDHGSAIAISEALTSFPIGNRVFLVDESSALRKIHVMNRTMMSPEHCNSEYCQDLLQYWFPVVDAVAETDPKIPFLFQFSDEEVSIAFEPATGTNVSYPGIPHMKKVRLALSWTDAWEGEKEPTCIQGIRQPHPTLDTRFAQLLPTHLQPIIFKLKTNRHYGMLHRIPPQDLPWEEKQNQAVFRGTLTGFLPPSSQFSVSTRNSNTSTLSNDDARKKCQLLDRCRLVYEVNQFYKEHPQKPQLVNAHLVPPKLQHVDMPESIDGVLLYGNRMTKQAILKYKAIVVLEGNDVATGLKWALFSNSVVLAPAVPRFTSWAMEELLVPWHHFVPLNMSNLFEDVHEKMRWVLDHEDQAKTIAKQGSLWIRDLWIHPDAASDDEKITSDIVRRYAAHFRPSPALMVP